MDGFTEGVDTVIVIFGGETGDTFGGIDEDVKLSTPDLIDDAHHLEYVTWFVEITLDDSITCSWSNVVVVIRGITVSGWVWIIEWMCCCII